MEIKYVLDPWEFYKLQKQAQREGLSVSELTQQTMRLFLEKIILNEFPNLLNSNFPDEDEC